MPFTIDFSPHKERLVQDYGNELNADMVKEYCNEHGVSYQTITKYLNMYKVKRGHWSITDQ